MASHNPNQNNNSKVANAELNDPHSTRPWQAIIAIALGFFVTVLDVTIINIAVPDIAGSLAIPVVDVLWSINAYTICITAILITMGRLGDYFGPKFLIQLGITIFIFASVLCGIATSGDWLVIARILQAIGAAMLMPQGMVIITRSFNAEDKAWAFGIVGAVGGIAAIAGPTIGGLLVEYLNWQFVFFINIPIGIAVLIMTHNSVPEAKVENKAKLDIAGLILCTMAMSALSYALMEWDHANSLNSTGMLLAALFVLFVFIVHQHYNRNDSALMPTQIFQVRSYTSMLLICCMNALGILSLTILLSVYLQTSAGFNAVEAGFAIAPASLFSAMVSMLIGKIASKMQPESIVKLGLLVTGVGILVLNLVVNSGFFYLGFIIAMVIIGIGNGLTVAPSNLIALKNMTTSLVGAASGFLNTIRQFGMLMGVVVLGVLIPLNEASIEAISAQSNIALAMQASFMLPLAAIGLALLVALFGTIPTPVLKAATDNQSSD